MKRVVISDTSCLIVLSKIGYLHLLQSLFGKVLITEEVKNEFGEALPDWIIVKKIESHQNSNSNYSTKTAKEYVKNNL